MKPSPSYLTGLVQSNKVAHHAPSPPAPSLPPRGDTQRVHKALTPQATENTQTGGSAQSRADLASPNAGPTKRGNARKTHDSSRASAFLSGFVTVGQLYEAVPEAEDLFAGVALLKSSGNTATRATVKRAVLFGILRSCPTLTTDSVNEATGGRYGAAQVHSYAAHARVVCNALTMLLDARPDLEEQWALDADADDSQFLTYRSGTYRGEDGSHMGWSNMGADLQKEGSSIDQTTDSDVLWNRLRRSHDHHSSGVGGH